MLLAVLLGAIAARASASPSPYVIFDRARAVLSAQRYPKVVAYTVDVTAAGNAEAGHRHYHEYWSASDNRVYVKPPESDEQLLHPYEPSAGVNFMGWNIGGPRRGTGIKDFIGVPVLAPNYTFGLNVYTPPSQLTPAQLVEQIRREYHDPAPQKVNALAQESGLKTIALVTSAARVYRISLVGIVSGARGSAYHLSLRPLEDPLKYRLRDLWIDAATYEVERARIGGNFTDVAAESVPWMVRFQQIGGATYIAQETAEQPIAGYHGLMYTAFSVSFGTPEPGAMPPFSGMTSITAPLTEP